MNNKHIRRMMQDSSDTNSVQSIGPTYEKEDVKVSTALENLATDKQDNSAMGQRIYSVPSQDKLNRSKLAQKTGQIPKSVNVYGSHYPVVRLLDDNKTLLLHTSEYGNDGKTKELVAKIKQDLPNHFPDARVIEIHHPDYRHSAKVMRSRDPKEFSNYLKLASEKHPDENYRSHALDALNHLSSLKKAEYGKPIHAKRTESEGFDYEANLKNRLDKIHGYLTKLGLSLDTSEGKSRNMGAHNPNTITINTEGDPHDQQALHEAGHALLTSPNQSISEYQKDIGKPGFEGKLTQTRNRQKLMESHGGGMPEQTAQHMEAGIARRSGIEPFKSPKRGKEGSQEEKARTHAKNTLKDLDEGIYKFNFKTGQKELQSNPNTMINARARGDKQLVNQMTDQYKQKLSKQDMKLAASENSESDLAKGQNGDWQKEGYRLEHSRDLNGQSHQIHAYSPKGEKIGEARIKEESSHLVHHPEHELYINPSHRRKGLATAMYNLIENKTGKKIKPSEQQSLSAKALWNQPNKPFGKSES